MLTIYSFIYMNKPQKYYLKVSLVIQMYFLDLVEWVLGYLKFGGIRVSFPEYQVEPKSRCDGF